MIGYPCKKLSLFQCLFILQCGDIECNPGPRPPKNPCQLCGKACKWSEKAVQCDSYDLWHHVNCMSMNTQVYDALQNPDMLWTCCKCGLPSINSSLFSNTSVKESVHSNSYLSEFKEYNIKSPLPRHLLPVRHINQKK